MPYAVLEKDFNELTEDRKRAVVLFVRFLASQQVDVARGNCGQRKFATESFAGRQLGGFEKGFRIADDFDAPIMV